MTATLVNYDLTLDGEVYFRVNYTALPISSTYFYMNFFMTGANNLDGAVKTSDIGLITPNNWSMRFNGGGFQRIQKATIFNSVAAKPLLKLGSPDAHTKLSEC